MEHNLARDLLGAVGVIPPNCARGETGGARVHPLALCHLPLTVTSQLRAALQAPVAPTVSPSKPSSAGRPRAEQLKALGPELKASAWALSTAATACGWARMGAAP